MPDERGEVTPGSVVLLGLEKYLGRRVLSSLPPLSLAGLFPRDLGGPLVFHQSVRCLLWVFGGLRSDACFQEPFLVGQRGWRHGIPDVS